MIGIGFPSSGEMVSCAVKFGKMNRGTLPDTTLLISTISCFQQITVVLLVSTTNTDMWSTILLDYRSIAEIKFDKMY